MAKYGVARMRGIFKGPLLINQACREAICPLGNLLILILHTWLVLGKRIASGLICGLEIGHLLQDSEIFSGVLLAAGSW